MTPERWRQIKALLESALERTGHEREAFLDDACAGDPELRCIYSKADSENHLALL